MSEKDNLYLVRMTSASGNSQLTFEFEDDTTAMQFARIAKNYRDEEMNVTITIEDGRE